MKNHDFRNFGFARIAVAVPLVKVADCEYNVQQMILLIKRAHEIDADVVLFPELSVTSYTAGDLFHQDFLLEKSKEALEKILTETKHCNTLSVIGMPIACDDQLFNCAVFIQAEKVLGIVPKTYIPGYKEFYEKRWFSSANNLKSRKIKILGQNAPIGTDLLFKTDDFPALVIGAEICEDLWMPIPPSSYQALAGATLLLNLSASNDVVGKADYRRALVSQQSARCLAAYAYASAGTGESSTDVVFGGHGIVAENGTILIESERFSRINEIAIRDIDLERVLFSRRQSTSFGDSVFHVKKEFRIAKFAMSLSSPSYLARQIDAHPFVPQDAHKRNERCEEIFSIQTAALAKRLQSGGANKVLIGVSGGLDSTLALLVAVKTFKMLCIDQKNIFAFTMPGFGTTDRTRNNAEKLCEVLGVSFEKINIKDGCLQQFKDIGHDIAEQNVVFENVQARYRIFTLFSKGNQVRGLVMGTGDLSELALGWCTYAGDHISHYNVNAGVPKTLVKYLVEWISEEKEFASASKILKDVLATPISPELVGSGIYQKTEDIIGPYELHDFFLYHFARWGIKTRKILFLAEKAYGSKYPPQEIKKWLKVFVERFFNSQWKRSCLPDGPKVGSVSLSPRGDWRMPSDAEVASWLNELVGKEDK